jgi:hypothetical protein
VTLEAVMQDRVFAGPRFNLVLFGVFAARSARSWRLSAFTGSSPTGVVQQTHELGLRTRSAPTRAGSPRW